MARLIDAENQREINKVFKMQELFKAVMYVGDKCPTVEERKTGHWKYVTVTDDGYYLRVACSACENRFNPLTGAKHYNYCPFCGAKMEGEE